MSKFVKWYSVTVNYIHVAKRKDTVAKLMANLATAWGTLVLLISNM